MSYAEQLFQDFVKLKRKIFWVDRHLLIQQDRLQYRDSPFLPAKFSVSLRSAKYTERKEKDGSVLIQLKTQPSLLLFSFTKKERAKYAKFISVLQNAIVRANNTQTTTVQPSEIRQSNVARISEIGPLQPNYMTRVPLVVEDWLQQDGTTIHKKMEEFQKQLKLQKLTEIRRNLKVYEPAGQKSNVNYNELLLALEQLKEQTGIYFYRISLLTHLLAILVFIYRLALLLGGHYVLISCFICLLAVIRLTSQTHIHTPHSQLARLQFLSQYSLFEILTVLHSDDTQWTLDPQRRPVHLTKSDSQYIGLLSSHQRIYLIEPILSRAKVTLIGFDKKLLRQELWLLEMRLQHERSNPGSEVNRMMLRLSELQQSLET